MAGDGLDKWRGGRILRGLTGLASTLGLDSWRAGTVSSVLDAGVEDDPIVVASPIVNGAGFRIVPELYLANSTGYRHTRLSNTSSLLLDGTITMNVDQAVKMSCQVTITNPENISPYTDYLAPVLRYEYFDGSDDVEQQMGLYAIKIPPGDYRPEADSSVATFNGSDMTSVTFESKLSDTYNVAAGFRLTQIIQTLWVNSGLIFYSIPSSSTVFASTFSRPPRTSRGDMINDMLGQLGWYTQHADLTGRVTTRGESKDLNLMEPVLTLTNADIYSESVKVVPSDRQVANVAIVTNDNAGAAPLVGTYRNDDPASPSSTVNIGERVVDDVITGETTQAALNKRARQLINEGRSYYRTAEIAILPTPAILTPHQTIRLDTTGGLEDFAGLWWIRQAQIGLQPGNALAKLTISQVTKFDGTIV